MMTTPVGITPEMHELCKQLGCTLDPVFVRVETHRVAEENDCFIDVQKQQKDNGGEAVIGWQIWEWPGVMIEAEFHAVWRSPSGDLLDVSFKPDGEKQILFVTDPVRAYSGQKLDNVRVAVWKSPLVHEFIRVNEELQQEIVKRYGIGYFGEVQATGKLAELYHRNTALPAQIAAAFDRQIKRCT